MEALNIDSSEANGNRSGTESFIRKEIKMRILRFRLKKKATREQALNWLSLNCNTWPARGKDGKANSLQFYGWKFIESLEGVVYFANCIDRGITKAELDLLHKMRELPQHDDSCQWKEDWKTNEKST